MVEATGRQHFKAELIETAHAIVRPGYGILAADESTGTMGKRLAGINVENVVENRQAFRELLFTTPNMENHISGVIMFEETLDQATKEGTNFVELLKSKNVLTGIKVDKGLTVIGGTDDENSTQGLDGLAARCATYYSKGARFAKWRAVLKINLVKGQPTPLSIAENAHTLARYGGICQDNGLVPIIEPEILADGTHTIEECAEASEQVFSAVMKALIDHKLILEGTLLKPNMVTPGTECEKRNTPAEIAWMTVRTLNRSIVPALAGVTFLSGGQSEESASLNLNEMNKIDAKKRGTWGLSFSYGRALQSSTLKAWSGKVENVQAAQTNFYERCKGNGDATLGKYAGGSGEDTSLHVKNYTY
jgi:fructose-bisphosphate aldolase class I